MRRYSRRQKRTKQYGGNLKEYNTAVQKYLDDYEKIYEKYEEDLERDSLTDEYIAELLRDVFRVQTKEKTEETEWNKLTAAEQSEKKSVKDAHNERVLAFNSLFIDGWNDFLRKYIKENKSTFTFDANTMYNP